MRLFWKLTLLSVLWIGLAIFSGWYFLKGTLADAIILIPIFLGLTILSGIGFYFILKSYQKILDLINLSLQESRFTPPEPIMQPDQHNELADLVYQFNRFSRELRATMKTSDQQEKELSKKLEKSRKNMVKLTDNLERVVAKRTAELRSKDQQLLQSGKLAGLGQLSTGIAHEINQPLNIIKLIATGMLRQYSKLKKLDTEEVVKELNTINQQTVRVQKIIEHMKAFARKRSNESVSAIQINKPLEDALLLIGQQLKAHNILLELHLDPKIDKVEADPIQIEQILINLVNNARDAFDGKEPQTVANQSPFKKTISVQTWQESEQIFLEVRDNGCGMSAEVQQQLFDPFFSTKGQKGTGLGMAITYNLIKNMNAEIKLDSEPGAGTTFTIIFRPVSV